MLLQFKFKFLLWITIINSSKEANVAIKYNMIKITLDDVKTNKKGSKIKNIPVNLFK